VLLAARPDPLPATGVTHTAQAHVRDIAK
jgi:hypothetical protein